MRKLSGIFTPRRGSREETAEAASAAVQAVSTPAHVGAADPSSEAVGRCELGRRPISAPSYAPAQTHEDDEMMAAVAAMQAVEEARAAGAAREAEWAKAAKAKREKEAKEKEAQEAQERTRRPRYRRSYVFPSPIVDPYLGAISVGEDRRRKGGRAGSP